MTDEGELKHHGDALVTPPPVAPAGSGKAASTNDASCEISLRVRYAEVDPMGYLHHSRYWVFFEMGRTELLRLTGVTYRDLEAAGVFLVVVKGSVKYLAPARYDDELVLTTRMTKMGMVKIDHAYELRRGDDGTVLARAETTLGCVDREGKLRPLPDSIRGN